MRSASLYLRRENPYPRPVVLLEARTRPQRRQGSPVAPNRDSAHAAGTRAQGRLDADSIHHEAFPVKRKNPAAVALGRKGGKARMKKQTPEQRSESARNAARARWKKAVQNG